MARHWNDMGTATQATTFVIGAALAVGAAIGVGFLMLPVEEHVGIVQSEGEHKAAPVAPAPPVVDEDAERCATYEAAIPPAPSGFEIDLFECKISRWPSVSYKIGHVRQELARRLVKQWIENAIASGHNPNSERVNLSVYIHLERESVTGGAERLEQSVATYKARADRIFDGL